MKKFFSIVAVALAGALTASAGVQQNVTSAMDVTPQAVSKTLDATKGAMKITRVDGVQKAPSTRDEACGLYHIEYLNWLLQGEARPGFYMNVTPGVGANDFIIENFYFSGANLDATFNNGNIVIPQQSCTVTLSGETLSFDFMATNVELAEDGKTIKNLNEGGTVTLYPNTEGGFQSKSELDGFELRVAGTTDRYYYMCCGVVATAPDFFVYNAADWTDVKPAKFTDNFVNHFLNPEYQITEAVEVPCKKSVNNDGWYLLVNPYRQGPWAEINGYAVENNLDGYIAFNIANPEIVYTRILIGSGVWLNDAPEGEDPIMTELYPYNREGDYIFNQGYTPEDVLDLMWAGEMEPSYYDESTRTAHILNCLFGQSDDPTGSWWFGEDNPITFTVVLDDESGVNEIGVDANAPVKYFNLQGMEIVNPAKGQLVIKTQGNKAQKFIVK